MSTNNPSLVVQRLDRATDISSSAGLPYKCLVFPVTGGVQAIDAAGTVLPLVGATGSLIPSADNVDDLGSSSFRWQAGYFGTSVQTPLLNTQVGGFPMAVLALAAVATAVNIVTITSAALGGTPSIAATGSDTNIALALLGKGTGGVNLRNPANTITVLGAQNVSSSFFGLAVENAAADTTGGAVTINSVSGRFRLLSGGAGPFVITDNRVKDANSIVILQMRGINATLTQVVAVAAPGQFTVTLNAAPTVADADVDFIVVNRAV